MIALLFACQQSADLRLQDANNYAFTSEVTAAVTVVAPGTDTTVDWSALTKDFLEVPLDPSTDITTVTVIRFADNTEDDIMRRINEDDLPSENVFGFTYSPGGTSALLSDFDISGTFLDPVRDVVEGGGAYMVSASTETRFRTIELFRPVTGGDVVPIVLDNDSASIAFQVHLDAGEAIELPANTAEIKLDWADLTTNGSGFPIDLGNVDRLVLAQFDEDPATLEADFLHFDALAEQRFEIDTSGFGSAKLTRAATADGTLFTGFDDRTWYAALLCTFCINPAPPFITRVVTQ